MAHILNQDRTGFFTVVGAPPIAEEHQDVRSHYHLDSVSGTTGAFVAVLWLALYVAIVVMAIVGKGAISSVVDIIATALSY